LTGLFRIFLVTAAICVTTLSSCTKGETDFVPSIDPPPTVATFSCKTDSVPWAADSASWTIQDSKTHIVAYKGAYIKFEIILSGIVANVYPITQGTNDFIYHPASLSIATGTTGTIVISSYNNNTNRLTGSFGPIHTSGTSGVYTITDGFFTTIPKRGR